MFRLPAAAVLALLASASAQAATNADKPFADKAAAAGMSEVAEAKIALAKTHDPKVRAFAQRMVRDHTKANKTLMRIATGERLALPSSPSSADQAQAQDLQGKTGADFDESYLKAQLTAHEQAVAWFTGESQSGQDPNLKRFAGATLPTLRDHLKMVQALLPSRKMEDAGPGQNR